MERGGVGETDRQVGGGGVVEDAERRRGGGEAPGTEAIERRFEGAADVVGEPLDEAGGRRGRR